LDYETRTDYEVTVSVSDGKGGTASIMVIINVTDDTTETAPTNTAPVFTDGTSITHSIAENTEAGGSIAENTEEGENIGGAVGATDANTGDTLTYRLDTAGAETFQDIGTPVAATDVDRDESDIYRRRNL
jgi:hypothetical protein